MSSIGDVELNQTYAHLLARAVVRPLVGTWVTPNHLTGLRLILGGIACVLLAMGTMIGFAWSGVLWFAACLLDRADGELARLADLRSESGKIFDFYSDLLLDAGWFMGAGIGLFHSFLHGGAPLLGLITCVSMIVCIWYAEVFDRASSENIKAWVGTKRFHPDDALFLLTPLTWLGWVAPVLIVASICTPIIGILMYWRVVQQKRRRRA